MKAEVQVYRSPAAFSKLSGLSLATVYRRIKDGSLPSVQPGGSKTRRLIPVDALEQIAKGALPDLGVCDTPPTLKPTASQNQAQRPTLSGPTPKWRRSPKRA